MSHLDSLPERIRRGEPLSPALDFCLRALTPIQRAGMAWRLSRKPERVNAYVVSIGNLTAGGTGKTPAVIAHAQRAMAGGKRVAVLTRGYGSARTPEPLVLHRDNLWNEPYQLYGDEAVHIAHRALGVHVVKDKDRVRGARYACEELGCTYLILDDGFQSVRLARDEDILLVDATNPFGNGCLIPRGILRESPAAAARATTIMLTRCDQAANVWRVAEELRRLNPHAPLLFTRHAPTSLWRLCDGEIFPLDTLRGREVDVACAIAAPERFFALLETLGARIVERHVFPDHTAFPVPAQHGERWLVTTEKDAVRMAASPPHVHALGITLEEYSPKSEGS